MFEFLGVSLILFVLIALPLAVVMGGIVASTAIKHWFRLQTARLQFDRERFERELEMRKLSAEMPPWLDARDPVEIAHWRSAVREATAAGLLSRKN